MLHAYPLRKVLDTSSTSSDFTAKTPTADKPSGAGVIDLFDADLGIATDPYIPEYIQLIPYGSDAADEAFDMRVWGWSKTVDGVWIPQLLLDLTVTLGDIAATALASSNFLADTIVVNEGPAGENFADEITTADDTPASIMLHLRGCELIEFDFDMTSTASANCLWRVMDES